MIINQFLLRDSTLKVFCFRPDEFKFGCTSLRVPPEVLHQLRNDINVSPGGIAFVKVLELLFQKKTDLLVRDVAVRLVV